MKKQDVMVGQLVTFRHGLHHRSGVVVKTDKADAEHVDVGSVVPPVHGALTVTLRAKDLEPVSVGRLWNPTRSDRTFDRSLRVDGIAGSIGYAIDP